MKQSYTKKDDRIPNKPNSTSNDFINTIGSEKVLEITGRLFGNLKRVDVEVLETKRTRMEVYAKDLVKINSDILDLLHSSLKKQGYKPVKTIENILEVFKQWKQFIELHPHKWPRSVYFKTLYNTKKLLLDINNVTHDSLKPATVEKNLKNFKEWGGQIKEIYPSIDNSPLYNFDIMGDDINLLHNKLVSLLYGINIILHECVHPSYRWNETFENSFRDKISHAPKNVKKSFENSKQDIIKQLPVIYFNRIGVSNEGMDWSDVIFSYTKLSKEDGENIGNEAYDFIRSNPEIDAATKEIFGKEPMRKLQDVLGKQKHKK